MENFLEKIPYGRQSITKQDLDAVLAVLESDFLTQGPAIPRFEKAVADHCGVPYAVVVSSATAALHLACLAAGLGPGDLLLTSPNTFVASANCALYCGAKVDFVDIDPRTYNMSLEMLRIKLETLSLQKTLPKIIIPVHFSGQSCEMDQIYDLATKYGITVIEDASHAIGGTFRGKPIGSCEFSDMAVFSFHPVKIITTGEGGMILTRNKKLYEKLSLLRSHGITRDPNQMTEPSHGPWYYQQIKLGFNYRLTDIQAALGYSQMQRLHSFIKRRNEIANRYDKELSTLPLIVPWQSPHGQSARHLYVVRLKLDLSRISHLEAFELLRAKGIEVNLHYIPVHLQPYYKRFGFKKGDFPEAEKYYGEAISLPMYHGLTDTQQTRVIEAIHALPFRGV